MENTTPTRATITKTTPLGLVVEIRARMTVFERNALKDVIAKSISISADADVNGQEKPTVRREMDTTFATKMELELIKTVVVKYGEIDGGEAVLSELLNSEEIGEYDFVYSAAFEQHKETISAFFTTK